MAHKFAVVKWLDASMNSPHWQEGDLPALPTETSNMMTSCGFVARENKRWVVLVQTLGEGVHANSIEIPRAMIEKITILKEATID